MLWKKKKLDKRHDSKIILGMVMLNDNNSFDIDLFSEVFKNNYAGLIREPSGDSASFVFKSDNELVAIAHMDVPIPIGDIEGTAEYAYNWQSALADTINHKSHLIVSLMNGGQDQIKRFKIFTKVICSLLRTTNAVGVYKGNQSLLIPKDDYLNEAEAMSDEYLPLNLWIYFGLRVTDDGNSAYTYGLKEFNKTEMEVVNSSKSLEQIRGILFNIAHYVLDYNVTFEDGQTIGGSEDEKIAISFSKGKFVEGDSFKLSC
jgi:hypothetical protein